MPNVAETADNLLTVLNRNQFHLLELIHHRLEQTCRHASNPPRWWLEQLPWREDPTHGEANTDASTVLLGSKSVKKQTHYVTIQYHLTSHACPTNMVKVAVSIHLKAIIQATGSSQLRDTRCKLHLFFSTTCHPPSTSRMGMATVEHPPLSSRLLSDLSKAV